MQQNASPSNSNVHTLSELQRSEPERCLECDGLENGRTSCMLLVRCMFHQTGECVQDQEHDSRRGAAWHRVCCKAVLGVNLRAREPIVCARHERQARFHLHGSQAATYVVMTVPGFQNFQEDVGAPDPDLDPDDDDDSSYDDDDDDSSYDDDGPDLFSQPEPSSPLAARPHARQAHQATQQGISRQRSRVGSSASPQRAGESVARVGSG